MCDVTMEDFKKEFNQLKLKMKTFDKDYKKKLLFLGLLHKYLKKLNSGLILLDGLAVQFYTAGEYLTSDIDLACNNRNSIKDLLISIQFKEIGRHFYLEDLDLSIEIPTSSITPNQQKKLNILQIDGYEIPILGIEDIIIDRLNAFTHWQSLEDGRIAKELIFLHYEKIDWEYLETQAFNERVEMNLKKFKDEILNKRETK